MMGSEKAGRFVAKRESKGLIVTRHAVIFGVVDRCGALAMHGVEGGLA